MALSSNFLPSPSRSATRYTVDTLIRKLDRAVAKDTVEARVEATRRVIAEAAQVTDLLPEMFLQTCDTSYARRLLHADPAGRYSVLVMVWDKGQGTPLHDHGGLWVVECLYRGRMRVTNYDYLGEDNGIHRFEPKGREQAVAGDTEFRIPPVEHHVVQNDLDTPSVTIHVFGGLLQHCDIFEPVEGGYRKVAKTMASTE